MKQLKLGKCRIRLITLVSLSFAAPFNMAFADDSPAVYFAKQAGVIAGAAEACGQPISLMVMRSGEVINAITTDPMDKTYATAAFEKAQAAGRSNMSQSQQLSCPKVISDFNNLPLLQPDYKMTVIQPLLANNPQAAANKPPASPVAPSPQLPSASNNATPNVAANNATNNTQLPPSNTNLAQSAQQPVNALPPNLQQGTTPQSYVNGNNPAVIPPINPGYNTNNTANPNSDASNTLQGINLTQQKIDVQATQLQLAQQLAQMAQTLATNSQVSANIGAGQPSANNPLYNSQLNEQLLGIGANNPLFTGQPLTPAIKPNQ